MTAAKNQLSPELRVMTDIEKALGTLLSECEPETTVRVITWVKQKTNDALAEAKAKKKAARSSA